ncbi:MAG: branched-chain amino acid ABC transporter permease [Clostridia bacterium]|nr:branched-chain amino acid ABC transporter permease [Clostridia bacterium]
MKNNSIKKYLPNGFTSYVIVIIAFAVLYPMQATGNLSSKISGLLIPVCAYIVMALSLNLTVGILGELSLGHAGFMSVGAFSGVIASAALQDSVASAPIRLLISMVIGAFFAAIAGLIVGIPVLRLRGDYLAIVTLAFGEIIKNVVSLLYVGKDAGGLHISMKNTASLNMTNGRIIMNGPQGAVGVTKISTFTAGIILILLTLFIINNLVKSRAGRAITALRDNRIAAESIGLNVTKYKLITFVVSAALAGTAGVLYGMNFNSFAAAKFDFNTSILVLVFVVLGGMGNMTGSIIATTVLYLLPELLREFSDYRMLLYAIVLILVMIGTNSKRAIEIKDRLLYKLTHLKFKEKEEIKYE